MTSMMASLRSGVVAAVGAQVILTLASVGNATLLATSPSSTHFQQEEEVFDAPHYDYVTEFITKMYSGRGITRNHNHNRNKQDDNYVQLGDQVIFTDPAATCQGPHEVREAFRALHHLTPKSKVPPRCIHVQPQGESIALSYALHQEYLSGQVVLQSLLFVTVQLRQRKDVPESEFVITHMEELWNGVPLWNSYLFRIVRRINGMASWHLTRSLLL